MDKDVVISIYGLQEGEDGPPGTITLVTRGQLARREGRYVVSYEESELTGLKGTHTTLSVDDDRVALTRTGLYPSQMVFEKGRRHTSLYHTDYGDMLVGLSTQSIHNDIGPEGGSLLVRYAVEIDHSLAGMNHLKIDVRPAEDGAEA
jgi:uncharacterized beta-barrel protein YwiB (DUF1934 family)